MNFASTGPFFQAQISAIASVAGMTCENVYDLWCKYDRACTLYDQSPILVEFVGWYAYQLGGNQAALTKALQDEEDYQAYQADQNEAYEESVRQNYWARGLGNVY
jgi:hypothetical protein